MGGTVFERFPQPHHRRREELADGRDDDLGGVDDVVAHEALDSPTGGADLAVELPVTAGGGPCAMEGPAVDLDGERPVWPSEVHVVPPPRGVLDRMLPRGMRQAGVAAECEEAALGHALRQRRVESFGAQAPPQVANASRPADARQDVGDGLDVEDAQHLGLLDRTLQLMQPQHRPEVYERARDRGARDAVVDPAVLGTVDLRAMEADAVAVALSAARDHDVDDGRAGGAQPEVGGAGGVRQRRALATGQNRRHEEASTREIAVTYGIDAFMDSVQPSREGPPIDLLSRAAEFEQLCVRDHASLCRRNGRHASRDE
jgi:hypothetical protein